MDNNRQVSAELAYEERIRLSSNPSHDTQLRELLALSSTFNFGVTLAHASPIESEFGTDPAVSEQHFLSFYAAGRVRM